MKSRAGMTMRHTSSRTNDLPLMDFGYRNAFASGADFIVVGREMPSVDQLRG